MDATSTDLTPLTAAEFATVVTAVRASPLIPARPLTFHYVDLDEPDKADVISQVTSLPLRALVIARADGQSHELRVESVVMDGTLSATT
ncbi:hypothetical protein EJB05_13209, partial [Eragrostis curvula]